MLFLIAGGLLVQCITSIISSEHSLHQHKLEGAKMLLTQILNQINFPLDR